jgi:murein L,D-transpeptidase YafK
MKKIILLFILIYLLCYVVFVNLSVLRYNEMDFNKNGFVELSEAFQAIDIGTREVKTDDKICTEYFFLKDGIKIFDRCKKLPYADLVIVNKSRRELYLSKNGKVFRTYHISLGANPKGHKVQEGDEKTPEGDYILDYKKPNSSFFKAIHISYPNKKDIKKAKHLGVSPGGFIMIHGQKNHFEWLSFLTQKFDWTNGCIAVTNEEMKEIWQSVNVPTPIKILQ